MSFIKHPSIRAKLILMTMACSGVALLLSCAGFVFENAATGTAEAIERLQSQARMLAFNSTAVLSFEDQVAAEQLLQSLRLEPSIEYGCLLNSEGELLSEYKRNGSERELPSDVQFDGHRFSDDGFLELHIPVEDRDEVVGAVFLQANLNEVQHKFASYLRIVSAVSVGAFFVSLLFSIMLQRTITRPLVQLTQTAQEVAKTDDYTIRVPAAANDELGILCNTFNHMLDQVETSRNALKGAVANMSHEIRTPINAILGFTQLLRQEGASISTETRNDYLDTIFSSSQHLLSLLNDILDLSKIESGQMEMVFEPTSPHQILADVVSVLRVRAGEKGIALNARWQGKVPETIQTDPDRLRQLLMNLVSNAVKFTQMGGVHIFARLETSDSNPMLLVEVVDSGIGIAPDKVDTIFSPFVQADNSVTRRFGGTGLGLAISRRIARALGGDITVKSELGVGTTFAVRIAVGCMDGVEMLDGPIANSEVHRPATPIALTSLPALDILVVEDGETNRKLIRVILERAGATVTMADNGQIGVEFALRHNFDVILMDMQMPVMDGYAATRRLREHGLSLPIIALTAHAMKGDEAKCLAAGCSGYLTKPIDTELLLRTVRDATLKPGRLHEDVGMQPASKGRPLPDETPETDERSSAHADPIYSSLPCDDLEFREIVEEFIDRLHSRIELMEEKCREQDMDELARLAHWLKGSGGTAGFACLTEPAKALEDACRNSDSRGIRMNLNRICAIRDQIALPDYDANAEISS